MQTLSIVEGVATALAAPLLAPVDSARAQEVNAAMREGLTHFDPLRFTALNREFHGILFEYIHLRWQLVRAVKPDSRRRLDARIP